MTELETIHRVVRASLAALEASRRRIDDLNVYPVPDGDTGTNLTLTARSVAEALGKSRAADRAALAKEITRAALTGARGNSGVILSQIVRGAAEVLGRTKRIDPAVCAAALRGASDAAYRAVRKPVEGTMLTVIRELAEEGERRAQQGLSLPDFIRALVRHGEAALARTPEQLAALRQAGVVDAGGAGIVEIVRGLVAGVTGERVAEAPAGEALSLEAVHRELSRFRYCTVFLVEGEGLDAAALEHELKQLGDSLLVVGDSEALKVHVHTDDPGAALRLGTAVGVIDGIEIANMHEQAREREGRLAGGAAAALGPASSEAGAAKICEAVAVVTGAGNVRLFASLGAGRVIEGGPTMNPSTQEILDAIEASTAGEAVVLPNNRNVVMSADQAAALAGKPVCVVRTESIQAGLAAMVAYDPAGTAEANAVEMHEALEGLATGAIAISSKAAEVDGVHVREGAYLGLVATKAVASGESFDEVACAVADRLLSEPRELLTLVVGETEPDLAALIEHLSQRHPLVELDVQVGGQPHYPLLLSVE